MSNEKHCYIGAHTSVGYTSLLHDWIDQLKRLYILHGSTYKLKSAFLKKLGQKIHEFGTPITYLHSLQDVNELEGLIIPDHSIMVIDGNTDHSIKLSRPGIRDILVDFSAAYVEDTIHQMEKDLLQEEKQIKELKEGMYQHFALAKAAHEQKEKIYVSAMDMYKANAVAQELIRKIFQSKTNVEEAKEQRYFLGASTANGAINFIEQITQSTQKRYIIKGRSGSGKSTLMRKVAQIALQHGTTVEYYHCSFDPKSLDMIVLPSFKLAILDGTSPHVIDPSRENDEVIDMFERTIDPRVEVDYKDQLEKLNRTYRTHINEAIKALQKIKSLDDKMEHRYLHGIDPNRLRQLEQHWLNQIVHSLGVTS